jgi:hypothetical protein
MASEIALPVPKTSELKILRIPDRYAALGIATHFLARRGTFDAFPFGEMLTTIDGQIERKHYCFAFMGQKLVGYTGYAVYSAADAKAFTATGKPPPLERSSGSDVLWLLTMAAVDDAVVDAMTRRLSHEFAGKRVMGIRQKRDGTRRFFNMQIRDRLNTA